MIKHAEVLLKNDSSALKNHSCEPRCNVEASNPPTFTCVSEPNTRPDGLIRKTRPFAFSAPCICDIFPFGTVFKAIDLEEGWTKLTVLLAPIENSSHKRDTRSLLWKTSTQCVCRVITAWPPVTDPPCGKSAAKRRAHTAIQTAKKMKFFWLWGEIACYGVPEIYSKYVL